VSLAIIDKGNGFLDLAPVDRQLGKPALQTIGVLHLYQVRR
jgi:hypothetical protein